MFSFSGWNSRTTSRSRNLRPPKRRTSSDPFTTGNDRFPSAGGSFVGRMCHRSRIVASLLLLTILWPVVHLTTRVPSPMSRKDFIDDTSLQNAGNENEVLQSVSQASLDVLKEPGGIIYADNSGNWNQLSSQYVEGSKKMARVREVSLPNMDKEATTKGVITINNERIMLQKSESVEQSKDMGIQQPRNAILSDRMEGKDLMPSIGTSRKVEPVKSKVTTSDARVRAIKDQLVRAKVYIELGPAQLHPHFIKELQEQIKDVETTILGATQDSELAKDAYEKLKSLEHALVKGKQIIDSCASTEKRLRATIHSTEQKLQAETEQTHFLTHVAAKSIPRRLHCLTLRLFTKYYSSNSSQQNQFLNQEKFEDPKLFHYALFSDNILAAAVVVNSTLVHAKNPRDHVFHVVTDRVSYVAMRMWFLDNPPGEAVVQVQKVEEFTWLNSSYSPVLKQLRSKSIIDYYFRTVDAKYDGNLKYRNPKYLSILNHLRFYLPDIFPKLYKVVFLDDDVVVQKDLTGLWGVDLQGNVNGAVETCGKNFHRFDRYLNFSNPLIANNFDPHACGWAYGMNVFDLVEWRKQNITAVYHAWQELNKERTLWKLGTLPPGLIIFYNRTLSLDRSWHVLGLGYDERVKEADIDRAAVIHYNGNRKPWLEIRIAKFHSYWSKYVDYEQIYLRECNIIPL